jgi:hypothetical protein
MEQWRVIQKNGQLVTRDLDASVAQPVSVGCAELDVI